MSCWRACMSCPQFVNCIHKWAPPGHFRKIIAINSVPMLSNTTHIYIHISSSTCYVVNCTTEWGRGVRKMFRIFHVNTVWRASFSDWQSFYVVQLKSAHHALLCTGNNNYKARLVQYFVSSQTVTLRINWSKHNEEHQ